MTNMVTLIARTAPLERELKMKSRTTTEADVPRLGELYFSAYEPGFAGSNSSEAAAAVDAVFKGKYGSFLPDASHVALDENGEIIAAIMVVERSTTANTPEAPFIVELFTAHNHRRQGLAEQLVLASMDALFNAGFKEVALRVHEDNSAALALYLSLDFSRWSADEDED
ncbi:MAG: GNAT family N-acetyltransferase [Acidobacteria bacterium]|nr:GNAT family N-acetyltransferase [Acidobacteriota bacterium]